MLSKLEFTEKGKAALPIATVFFSNAAWFAINVTWAKQNRTFYIYYTPFL